VPEWELIATRIFDYGEQAIRGGVPADTVLARLEEEVNRILERRRWLLARALREATDMLPANARSAVPRGCSSPRADPDRRVLFPAVAAGLALSVTDFDLYAIGHAEKRAVHRARQLSDLDPYAPVLDGAQEHAVTSRSWGRRCRCWWRWRRRCS